jgi:hypothetical protein
MDRESQQGVRMRMFAGKDVFCRKLVRSDVDASAGEAAARDCWSVPGGFQAVRGRSAERQPWMGSFWSIADQRQRNTHRQAHA